MKPITVTTYLWMSTPSGSNATGVVLYVNTNDGATFVSFPYTTTTWNISTVGGGGAASPTLTLNAWYRMTQIYTPGGTCDTYYALASSTTDILLSSLGAQSVGASTIINFNSNGTGPLYIGRRTMRWGT